MDFLIQLKKLQEELSLTDKQMAERLGCSRSLYQITRRGKVPLGNKILKGVVAAFPELKEAAISLLTGAENKPASPLENQRNGALRRLCGRLYKFVKHCRFLGKGAP